MTVALYRTSRALLFAEPDAAHQLRTVAGPAVLVATADSFSVPPGPKIPSLPVLRPWPKFATAAVETPDELTEEHRVLWERLRRFREQVVPGSENSATSSVER